MFPAGLGSGVSSDRGTARRHFAQVPRRELRQRRGENNSVAITMALRPSVTILEGGFWVLWMASPHYTRRQPEQKADFPGRELDACPFHLLPRAVAASSAATRLPKTPRCKLQKTRLEVVLPPELIPTLRALIASTPLMSLPLFCLPTPLAIAGPCLLSCPNVADKTL